MPPKILLIAGSLASLLAACSGSGHVETHAPAGLLYACDVGGAATISFNGGGYQPEGSARAVAHGQPSSAAVPRSVAELNYNGQRLRMLPEWTERGLRYRSEARYDGRHYLVWTQRGEAGDPPERWTRPERPRDAEDVRLGRRTDLVAQAEREAEGDEVALCRRSGRTASAPAAGGPHDQGAREEPHRR